MGLCYCLILLGFSPETFISDLFMNFCPYSLLLYLAHIGGMPTSPDSRARLSLSSFVIWCLITLRVMNTHTHLNNILRQCRDHTKCQININFPSHCYHYQFNFGASDSCFFLQILSLAFLLDQFLTIYIMRILAILRKNFT